MVVPDLWMVNQGGGKNKIFNHVKYSSIISGIIVLGLQNKGQVCQNSSNGVFVVCNS